MKCTNCGREVPDTAKVCGHCGHRLKATTPVSSVPTRQDIPGLVWGLGGFVVALILIGALAYKVLVNLPASVPTSPPPVRATSPAAPLEPTVRPSSTPEPAQSMPIGGGTGKIYFFDANGDLYSLEANGTDLQSILKNKMEMYGAADASFSPDGVRLVFGNYHMYIVNADGSNLAPVNVNYGHYSPSWSPQGLIVTSSQATIPFNLWVMNPDGSGLRRLTNHPDVYEECPRWSPDGDQVAYEADTGIWTVGFYGSGATRVTTRKGCPAWSPDGQWIVFLTQSELRRVKADGTGEESVVTDVVQGLGSPDISPDGEWIAFHTKQGISIVRMDGSEKKQIYSGVYTSSGWGSPVWQPGG
jgi:WD40 repeat protein